MSSDPRRGFAARAEEDGPRLRRATGRARTYRYVLPVRPVPWRVPPMQAVKRNGHLVVVSGRDKELAAYQEAVREALREQGARVLEPPYRVMCWFWRSLAPGEKPADATNLLKAAEDALQGVLIGNDRDDAIVFGYIVAQEAGAPDSVAVEVEESCQAYPVPDWIIEQNIAAVQRGIDDAASNHWP